jgi:glycosyltransferase involved in cell wall biosynthesis
MWGCCFAGKQWPDLFSSRDPFQASMNKPLISCLCPTYNRPAALINNTIALFLAQSYPKAELLILDDLPSYPPAAGSRGFKSWSIATANIRYPSLPAKYNALLRMARGDFVCVWEDDDVYHSHHLDAMVAAATDTQSRRWSKPSRVWSLYNSQTPFQEDATGRFHAALMFHTQSLKKAGGWIETDSPTFDQLLIQKALELWGEPGDPLNYYNNPSYVFRWQSTHATHGQGTMHKGNDWYRAAAVSSKQIISTVNPELDPESFRITTDL